MNLVPEAALFLNNSSIRQAILKDAEVVVLVHRGRYTCGQVYHRDV